MEEVFLENLFVREKKEATVALGKFTLRKDFFVVEGCLNVFFCTILWMRGKQIKSE